MTMFPLPLPTVISSVVLFASAAAESPPLNLETTYAKASFVPTAAPALVSPLKPSKSSVGWPSAVKHPSRAQQQQIANGYGTYHAVSKSSSLFAKKKRGSGEQPAFKKGKVQVLLLETIPNIGQTGDIVSVSSAVFHNKLQLSNKARLVAVGEVERIQQEETEQEAKLAEMAMKTKKILEEAMVENLGGEDQCDAGADICGVALTMKRKARPEGSLFGGVNPKMVMEALKETFPEGSWDGRQVKLKEVKDLDGKDVKKNDVKKIGDYTVSVALHSSVDVTFVLSVVSE